MADERVAALTEAVVVPEDNGDARTTRSLSLTTGGLTLLGVLLSIGTTVGMGLQGSLATRLLAGGGTLLALIVVVKLGTSSGRGPIARLANWVIGVPDEDGRT